MTGADSRSDSDGSEIHRGRRNDLAKEALDIGMEDPYWLYNLRPDLHYHDGMKDMLSMAENLRDDAEALEKAHAKLKDGDWTGAEAAVYIARRATFGDYDIKHWLSEDMPITEDP